MLFCIERIVYKLGAACQGAGQSAEARGGQLTASWIEHAPCARGEGRAPARRTGCVWRNAAGFRGHGRIFKMTSLKLHAKII